MQSMIFPIMPVWIIALVGAALLMLLLHGCMVLVAKNVPNRWILTLAVIRIVIIAVFIACLLRPMLSHTATTLKKPDLLVLVDISASMGKAQTSPATSRLDRTLHKMQDSGLVKSLQRDFETHWYAFDRDARPIDLDKLKRHDPTGKATAAGHSMATAWSHFRHTWPAGLGQPTPDGSVLLVTDGNNIDGQQVARTAQRNGLNVHTLAAVDTGNALPFVIVNAVQRPQRVLAGSTFRIRATITHHHAQQIPLVTELSQDGQLVMSHQWQFTAGQRRQYLDLTHQPTSAGLRQYTLTVRPDKNHQNLQPSDPYEFTINVVGRQRNVLILEDTWRWEFKFLRRLFENDPSFSFTAFISRGSGTYMQFAEPDRSIKLAAFPRSRAELQSFDVMILGDVKPKNWSASLVSSIHQMVVEKGKSLVVIAGPNLASWQQWPELTSLLPVELSRDSARPIVGPVNVQPTAEALASGLFNASPQHGEANTWINLPAMDQIYPPLRKRPAATILLDTTDHTNASGNIIVMAEHTVGRGRVLFIGTDTLWKWQTLAHQDDVSNTPYAIFWHQALRALAPARSTKGHVNLWLQADRGQYVTTETIQVQAELETDGPPVDCQLEAEVVLPDGRKAPLSLVRDAIEPNRWRAAFAASTAGRYVINAAALDDGGAISEVATTVDVYEQLENPGARPVDTGVLKHIASATGGQFVDTGDPDTWPSTEVPLASVQMDKTTSPWHNFTLLLILAGMLTIDWLVRLLRGYV